MPPPPHRRRCRINFLSLLRRAAGVLFALVIGAGLLAGGRLSDARWLAILGVGGLLLLVAVWPALPRGVPTTARTTVRLGVLMAVAFLLLSVQLFRIQVVQRAAIAGRVGQDPETGEVLANPRMQGADLHARRGRIYDRAGTVLADTVFEGETARRVWPEPESAYLVGYFSPLLYGEVGLEEAYDDELSGREGGNAITREIDGLLGRPPAGLDLHLTLDAGLQRYAHELLAGRPGAAVLLDVETGEVVALASNPHYDPNRLFTNSPAERDGAAAYWDTLVGDGGAPLVPRATEGLFTPGSTFKVVSAAAVLDAGFAEVGTVYEDDGALNVDGRVIVEQNRPDETQTEWALVEGMAWSLNVVFARVGLQLGPELMRRYAEAFGFESEVPFDLPVARSRIASTPDFLRSAPALADTAFGQGELQATPLLMALATAAVANGGKLPRPSLVERVTSPTGATVWEADPAVWRRAVEAEAAAATAGMMVSTVEWGVAQPALIEGAEVGGKTGTAETGDGRDPHAWFVGFAGPAGEAPRYAVAVVLEHGGSGLGEALPVGRDLLAAALAG